MSLTGALTTLHPRTRVTYYVHVHVSLGAQFGRIFFAKLEIAVRFMYIFWGTTFSKGQPWS